MFFLKNKKGSVVSGWSESTSSVEKVSIDVKIEVRGLNFYYDSKQGNRYNGTFRMR
jgi:hypothetical protein